MKKLYLLRAIEGRVRKVEELYSGFEGRGSYVLNYEFVKLIESGYVLCRDTSDVTCLKYKAAVRRWISKTNDLLQNICIEFQEEVCNVYSITYAWEMNGQAIVALLHNKYSGDWIL